MFGHQVFVCLFVFKIFFFFKFWVFCFHIASLSQCRHLPRSLCCCHGNSSWSHSAWGHWLGSLSSHRRCRSPGSSCLSVSSRGKPEVSLFRKWTWKEGARETRHSSYPFAYVEKRCLCGLACVRPFLFWLQPTLTTSLLLLVSGTTSPGHKAGVQAGFPKWVLPLQLRRAAPCSSVGL